MTSPGSGERRPDQPGAALTSEQAAALAAQHGLTKVGVRPPLLRYTRDVWRHRQFLFTLAAADSVARHQNNYLGVFWSVLNPLLLGLAYLAIFGWLLGLGAETENYVAFLVIGLFTFIFMSAATNTAARSMVDNTSLVRALRFPRALMPISVVLAELLAALPAFGILIVVALATGERPTWTWLLFPVAILIVAMITTGLALIGARVLHGARDLRNLIPLITRMLRYTSGIFFSVEQFAGDAPSPIREILLYQPVAVTLTMVRETLLVSAPLNPVTWLVAGSWAVLLLGAGFVIFWRAEASYGRG